MVWLRIYVPKKNLKVKFVGDHSYRKYYTLSSFFTKILWGNRLLSKYCFFLHYTAVLLSTLLILICLYLYLLQFGCSMLLLHVGCMLLRRHYFAQIGYVSLRMVKIIKYWRWFIFSLFDLKLVSCKKFVILKMKFKLIYESKFMFDTHVKDEFNWFYSSDFFITFT